MRRFKKFFTPSRTSPKGGRRACLCKDNTYSIKCCDGSLRAQGIGRITGLQTPVPSGSYGYYVQACEDGHNHHVHIHDTELVVGKTYYLTLENNHNECYTILEESQAEGIHINTASIAYDNCTTCEDAN
jgi:hypothetical protein